MMTPSVPSFATALATVRPAWPEIATEKPSAASLRTIASPMPRVPPVTSATRPCFSTAVNGNRADRVLWEGSGVGFRSKVEGPGSLSRPGEDGRRPRESAGSGSRTDRRWSSSESYARGGLFFVFGQASCIGPLHYAARQLGSSPGYRLRRRARPLGGHADQQRHRFGKTRRLQVRPPVHRRGPGLPPLARRVRHGHGCRQTGRAPEERRRNLSRYDKDDPGGAEDRQPRDLHLSAGRGRKTIRRRHDRSGGPGSRGAPSDRRLGKQARRPAGQPREGGSPMAQVPPPPPRHDLQGWEEDTPEDPGRGWQDRLYGRPRHLQGVARQRA